MHDHPPRLVSRVPVHRGHLEHRAQALCTRHGQLGQVLARVVEYIHLWGRGAEREGGGQGCRTNCERRILEIF